MLIVPPTLSFAGFLSVGANTYDINPLFSAGNSPVDYYGYHSPYGASSNTPDHLEHSDTLVNFLYAAPNGDLSMFSIVDIPQDGSGATLNLSMSSSGLAGTGLDFIVSDYPGDTFLWNDARMI